MKHLLRTLVCLAFVGTARTHAATPLAAERVTSPSGEVTLTFKLAADGAPSFAIDYLGQPLVLPSTLVFTPDLSSGFTQTAATPAARDTLWASPTGERRRVPDRYRELVVDLRHSSGAALQLTFRAYDEGAAFRSSSSVNLASKISLDDNQTKFRFPRDTRAWVKFSTSGNYTRVPTSLLPADASRPVTLEFADGRFAALTKVGESPWSLLLVARKPGELLTRNFLRLNLSTPSELSNNSWIKPGRVLRGFSPTMAGAQAAADYAVAAGIRSISLDPRWETPGFDVPRIVAYARARDLGIILSIESKKLPSDLEPMFRQYAQWGVRGVEVIRSDVDATDSSRWLMPMVALAAQHHLILAVPAAPQLADIERRWPHVFTVGLAPAGGLTKPADWNCTLPFTRGLFASIGPTELRGDGVTRAHHLALSVISSDPLAGVWWNDRPTPNSRDQDMEFFRRVPKAPDETKVLVAEIGRCVAIARRTADDWFVGAITNADPRQVALALTFLDPDREYLANIYTDDSAAPSDSTKAYTYRRVFSKDTIDLALLARGGAALWLTPSFKKR